MLPLYDDNPQIKKPIATYAIILSTLCAWVFIQNISPREICELGLIPQQIKNLPSLSQCSGVNIGYGSLVTHALMHGSWFHLLTNLWMLYVFGNNIEDTMGAFRFILFYLLCAVLSGLAFVFLSSDPYLPLVGASGAISGVMAAYFFVYPKAKISTFVPLGIAFFFLRIPSWVLLGYWSLLQVINLEIITGDSSYVAYSAHFGGLLAGAVLISCFKNDELVERHPYAGWSAVVPDQQTPIPKLFKYLNYFFLVVLVLAILP